MRLSPLLAAPLLAATAFAADELPKELRLSCDGKMNVVMDVPNPQSRSASFRLNLHLKDGAITDVQTGVVEGEQCMQEQGEIKCETTRTYPLPNATIRRHSSVII